MAIFKAENRKTAFLKTENRKTTFSKPKNRKWDPPRRPRPLMKTRGQVNNNIISLYNVTYCVDHIAVHDEVLIIAPISEIAQRYLT